MSNTNNDNNGCTQMKMNVVFLFVKFQSSFCECLCMCVVEGYSVMCVFVCSGELQALW